MSFCFKEEGKIWLPPPAKYHGDNQQGGQRIPKFLKVSFNSVVW